MEETWTFVQEKLLVHWPFLAFVIVNSVLAQILKTQVLTKDLAAKSKTVFWLRRVMPLLLILLGLIVGVLWPGSPSPGVTEPMHKAWYFMGAACVSIAGYNAFRNWIKRKYDIDLGSNTEPPKG